MGDFHSPRKSDVVNRLRRRIELLKRHQGSSLGRFHPYISNLYQNQARDTALLRQRWLESKAAKKAAKQKQPNKENSGQNDHRNHTLANKLRWKIDTHRENAASDVFNFDETDSPPNKKSSATSANTGETQLPSLQVQIVQQINNKRESQQTIHTNVTVSSIIKPQFGSGDEPHSGNANISTSVETKCKQEPSDDYNECKQTVHQGNANVGRLGLDDVDEIAAILEELKREEPSSAQESLLKDLPPEITAELERDLDEFEKVFSEVQKDSEQNDMNSNSIMFDPLNAPSTGLTKGGYPDSHSGMMGGYYESPPTTNSIPTPPSQFINPNVAQAGPAAERLKHLATQHQNQRKDSPNSSYQTPDAAEQFARRNGFSSFGNQSEFTDIAGTPTSQSQFTFNQAQSAQQYTTPAGKEVAQYGSTKPLSHFNNNTNNNTNQQSIPQTSQQSNNSSLQKLQNQVHTHFTQGASMQVTQTQHMQVTQGSHRTQISQSQQLQLQTTPQQVSLSQNQSFTVSQNANGSGPQQPFVDEQTKIQMIQEKYRQEQAQMHQGQGQMAPHYGPPPDYKMAAKNSSYAANNLGPSPLQTMQNMVNQTQVAGFSGVKSEVNPTGIHGGNHVTGQSSHVTGQGFPSAESGQTPPANYMQQRPPSYPSAASSMQQNVPMGSRGPRPNHTYTSAIMRNQRAPNVNVGPDGLNISQSRTMHDWPRPYMAQRPHGPELRGPELRGQAPDMGQFVGSRYPSQSSGFPSAAVVMQLQGVRGPNVAAVQGQSAMLNGNSGQIMMQQGMTISSQHPGAQGQQHPGAQGQQHPGAQGQRPGAQSQHPGAQSQHPGAQSQHPGAQSQHPGAQSQHPASQTSQGTFSMQQAQGMHGNVGMQQTASGVRNAASANAMPPGNVPSNINRQSSGYHSNISGQDDLMNFFDSQSSNPDFTSSDLSLLEEILGNK